MPPVSHQKKKNAGNLVEVLILECFVTISSDVNEIAKEDREYAAEAAIGWRKRMIKDGGLGLTDEVDARCLLLLISGFGIPDHVFKIQDIMDLIRASNVKGISAALRRSIFLIPKIPEVIDLMVKNNLEVEAADVAHPFGLEDKCHPQSILGPILHNDITNIQDGSSFQTSHEIVRKPECREETDVSNKPEESILQRNMKKLVPVRMLKNPKLQKTQWFLN
ncbi:protein FRIGIDA-like [Bidens hawaiensis]|uniref:protein FRIGIDA-like n=1 Tax=Bidens hawaiensis TaxID=980011 RepID=UPI00404948EC